MLAIPFMQRSFQYRMYEIEASTRLSYTSLVMANMILMAAGSMAVFSICAVVTSIGLKLAGHGYDAVFPSSISRGRQRMLLDTEWN